MKRLDHINRFFESLSLRAKITLSLGVMLGLLLAIGSVAYFSSKRSEYFRELSLESEHRLLAITYYRAGVRNRILETYESTIADSFRHRDRLVLAENAIEKDLGNLKKQIGQWSKEAVTLLASTEEKYRLLDRELDTVTELAQTGQMKAARERLIFARDRNFDNDFIPEMRALIQQAEKETLENATSLRQSMAFERTLIFLTSALGVLLTFLLGLLLSRSLGTKLKKLSRAVEEISKGNFQIEVKLEGKDELARFALALNGMARSLTEAKAKLADQQVTLVATSKLTALGEMAGGIAHEINNPLATIKLLTEQMEDACNEDHWDKAKFQRATNLVKKTCDRISKIVQGLRAFARDGEHDEFEKVAIQQIVNDTLALCGEQTKRLGIEVQLIQPNDPIYIECRATQISQVLLNLISNACDAVRDLDPAWIHIEVTESANAVQVAVTDSGAGIPKEIREKIMQPFFTTKEVGKGTGLGLSISQGIVGSHKGRLLVDENSQHTKFVIQLPKSHLVKQVVSA